MKRLKILLVDDEPETGVALRGWLERRGYESVYVDGPEAADHALATETFDVVLSDIQMPGNLRLEWIERRLQQECPPPILLMTGDPHLETAMHAANLPVAGYLLKPLDYDRTAALIDRLASEHQGRLQLRDAAREVTRLLDSCEPAAATLDPVSQQLRDLARALTAAAQPARRPMGATSQMDFWREAVAETIIVLEKTKHSFRSRELGELRQRLQRLLAPEFMREKLPCHLSAT